MSVSDPLLKQLKAYVLEFRTELNGQPVSDNHRSLETCCATIEAILRKGIKPTPSLFGLAKRDYWEWIRAMQKHNSNSSRIAPALFMSIDAVNKTKKVTSAQGRGRLFIRHALLRRCLSKCVETFITNAANVEMFYGEDDSILGNEILCEILMSLLISLNEVNFDLELKNSSFLDETWRLPRFVTHEIVPCVRIGIQVQYIQGRFFVVHIENGSVADDDGVLEIGDVIDELLGRETRQLHINQVPVILRQNRGAPIEVGVVKCKMADQMLFPPIIQLLKKAGKDYHTLQQVLDNDEKAKRNEDNSIPPPHAVLPEDELEQVPVHSEHDKAIYKVKYVGKVEVGKFGGVSQVEHVVRDVVAEHKPEENISKLQNVILELGETQVIVTDEQSKQEILRNSYTEVSSCGRRVDRVLYFCYIIGETTCTLSKEFVAHVFRANTDEESKTILCAIAQGFDRTHWFV